MDAKTPETPASVTNTTSDRGPSIGKYQPEGDRQTPILLAVGILLVIVVALYYFGRPKPVTTGQITNVWAVEQAGAETPRTWVLLEFSLNNAFEQEIELQRGTVKLVTEKNEYTDQPTPRGDVTRYMEAYPELKKSDAPVLASGTKIPVGGNQRGIMLLAFPVSLPEFHSRKSLDVNLQFYQGTVVFKK